MSARTVAIVLAAGQGKRMQSRCKKQYLLLKEKPLLFYSLKVFEQSFINDIVLVVGSGEIDYVRTEIIDKYGFMKVSTIVEGGKERYHSVINGLEAIAVSGGKLQADYVYIHDAARPFITNEMLMKVQREVVVYQACVVGMPVKDTIKIADTEGFAKETPNRKLVWQIQTPQTFSYPLIKEAYDQLKGKENELLEDGLQITDDAMVVEYMTSRKVKLIEGSYQNIKITTPEDLKVAELFLSDF